jgi:O-antigen ligase
LSKKISIKNITSIFAFILVFAVTFALEVLQIGEIATILFIPLGFIIFFLNRFTTAKKVLALKPLFWYLLFFLLASISILYSIDVYAAIDTQKKMLIVLMFTIAVFSYSMSSINAIRTMYKANVFVLFALIAYTFTLGVEMGGEQRIEESEITANTYGYYIFTGLFSLFLLYTTNRLNKAHRIIYIVIITVASIFSLWLILASASRGAAIIVSLLIGGNIFIISVTSKKTILKKVIISIFFFVGIFYFAVFFTNTFLNDSYLLVRFLDLNERLTPRAYHFNKAIEIGLDNPILGVGAGNYAVVPKLIEEGSFSHNSFAEAFANFGSIGIFIYFMIYYSLLKRILKNLKTNNIKLKIINYQILLFMLLFIVYNVLYVVYLNNNFMHFLFVIYAQLLLIDRFETKNKIKNLSYL